MIQNSRKVAGKIRTYVFSAYHVNRKTYVLFPYMLFAICAKTYHVMALSDYNVLANVCQRMKN